MWNDWTIGSFRAGADVTPGPLGEAMKRFAADPRDEAAANALYENPSYVGLTRTTCVADASHRRARGQRAAAVGDCDGELPDLPRRRLRARPRGPGVSGGRGRRSAATDEGTPSDASPMREDVMAAVATAVHASYPGTPIVPQMAAYATDGSVFRGHGIATYGVSGIFLKDSEESRTA